MPEVRQALYSLNAGEISKTALARVDLAKLRMACEVEENWLPMVLGPTQFRPGTLFLGRGEGDAKAYLFEFKRSDTAIGLWLAYEGGALQFYDCTTESFVTRQAVASGTANGDFTSDLSSWGDESETGGSIFWSAGGSGGLLGLLGTGFNYGSAEQAVGTASPGVEHALRIKIDHGDVLITIGSTSGAGDFWNIEVPQGEYSLAFVPGSVFHVRLGSRHDYPSYVESVQIEPAGRMTLTHPWTAVGDLDKLQYDRSNDVLFVACEGHQQRRLERRNTLDMRSWAIALYRVDDGPFRAPNFGTTTITPSDTASNINLVANRPLFQPGHLGAIFRLTQAHQQGRAILAGPNQATAPVRVSGIGLLRNVFVGIHNLGNVGGTSTITLQRSFSDPGAWEDVTTYNANGDYTFNDTLDNQIFWYRLIVLPPAWAGDFPTVAVTHSGSQSGIVRIIGVNSEVNAVANVIKHLSDTLPTDDWAEGEWSTIRGWPIAVALHDGRLFWQCDERDQGSVSDSFHSFDSTLEGDAGPINRTTVASKPHWMISALRLMIGSTLTEISVRASAFDEPLTATAFTPRPCSDRGSMQLRALNVDGRVVFVCRDKTRVFLLDFDAARADFVPRELTRLNQEICAATVVDMAVQRDPDTRIYLVLADGRLIVMIHEPNEDVSAFVPFTFGGDAVERVACLPGGGGVLEDKAYIYIRRGSFRCLERLGRRDEARGGLINKTIDSHFIYQGISTPVISGLPPHLEGRQVVVWADGQPLVTQAAPITISGGTAFLPAPVSNAVIGLPYQGRIKTAKLAGASQNGTSLTQQKRVGPISLVMENVAWKGVHLGRDFDHTTSLPATYRGRPLSPTEVLPEWDQAPAAFNGGWGSDPRICITAESPYPCTIMGIVFGEQANAGEDLPPPRER